MKMYALLSLIFLICPFFDQVSSLGTEVGEVVVTAFFNSPIFYVNATPSDQREAHLNGYVTVSRSSSALQNIVVSLQGTAEGNPVTITPSSLTFSYSDEKKNFTMSISVPSELDESWDVINVGVEGSWQFVPGIERGEVVPANTTLYPNPFSYVIVHMDKEKYSNSVGVKLQIPVSLINMGNKPAHVSIEVTNEEELGREHIQVEYPRIPTLVDSHRNVTFFIDLIKTSGMGEKINLQLKFRNYNPYGGTPDNIRRVIVPERMNITVVMSTSPVGFIRAPTILLPLLIVAIGGVIGLVYYLKKRIRSR